jgi:hypothetical protein
MPPMCQYATAGMLGTTRIVLSQTLLRCKIRGFSPLSDFNCQHVHSKPCNYALSLKLQEEPRSSKILYRRLF